MAAVSVLLMTVAAAALAAPPSTQAAPSETRDRYFKYAMTHQGDAEAGKKLFLEPQKIACGNCHTIDGSAVQQGGPGSVRDRRQVSAAMI